LKFSVQELSTAGIGYNSGGTRKWRNWQTHWI